MRLIIGVVLGVVVLFYIGAMFGFFPFTICDDLVIRAVAFCTLIICLVIAVCTCFIIDFLDKKSTLQGPMPTSARWEVTNSPKIPVKTVHSAGPMWASAPTTKYADAPGFAENFYRTTASCRAEQSPAPTNLLHQNSHVRYGRGCFGYSSSNAPV